MKYSNQVFFFFFPSLKIWLVRKVSWDEWAKLKKQVKYYNNHYSKWFHTVKKKTTKKKTLGVFGMDFSAVWRAAPVRNDTFWGGFLTLVFTKWVSCLWEPEHICLQGGWLATDRVGRAPPPLPPLSLSPPLSFQLPRYFPALEPQPHSSIDSHWLSLTSCSTF